MPPRPPEPQCVIIGRSLREDHWFSQSENASVIRRVRGQSRGFDGRLRTLVATGGGSSRPQPNNNKARLACLLVSYKPLARLSQARSPGLPPRTRTRPMKNTRQTDKTLTPLPPREQPRQNPRRREGPAPRAPDPPAASARYKWDTPKAAASGARSRGTPRGTPDVVSGRTAAA